MSVKTDPAQRPVAKADDAPAGEERQSRAGRYQINIYDAWCKKCGICVEFCPKNVLTIDALGSPEPTFQENCIGCTQCVLHCPDFAITVSEKKAEE